MTYLLDTNVVSVFVNGRSERLRERVRASPSGAMALCSVVWAELFYGVAKSRDPARTLTRVDQFAGRFRSLPFDDAAARGYGDLRAETGAGRDDDRAERSDDCRHRPLPGADVGFAQHRRVRARARVVGRGLAVKARRSET